MQLYVVVSHMHAVPEKQGVETVGLRPLVVLMVCLAMVVMAVSINMAMLEN